MCLIVYFVAKFLHPTLRRFDRLTFGLLQVSAGTLVAQTLSTIRLVEVAEGAFNFVREAFCKCQVLARVVPQHT